MRCMKAATRCSTCSTFRYLGREEDAADQFSILIALRLRPPLAVAAREGLRLFLARGMSDPDAMTKDGSLNQ